MSLEFQEEFFEKYSSVLVGVSEGDLEALSAIGCKAGDLDSFMDFLLLCDGLFEGCCIESCLHVPIMDCVSLYLVCGLQVIMIFKEGRVGGIVVNDSVECKIASDIAEYMLLVCGFKASLFRNI